MFFHIQKLCFVCVSLIAGAGKVRVQSSDHPLPRRWVPVPRHILLLTGHWGDRQVHRHRTTRYKPQDGRQALQIQLRPQAVHRHPGQVCVRQRGCPDHPQSPLAGQETRECTQEVRKRRRRERKLLVSFCLVSFLFCMSPFYVLICWYIQY